MYNRCQNVNRDKDKKAEKPPSKRQKFEPVKHMYAAVGPVESEDDVAMERNIGRLKSEIAKPKPNSDVMKELICRTFSARTAVVLTGVTSDQMLSDYPHLRKENYVS